jgi:hypothetical protein
MTQIESLVLQITGIDKENGRRLGEAVSRNLAANLPEGLKNRDLKTVNVQVTMPPGTSQDQMAHLIAKAIIRQIAMG